MICVHGIDVKERCEQCSGGKSQDAIVRSNIRCTLCPYPVLVDHEVVDHAGGVAHVDCWQEHEISRLRAEVEQLRASTAGVEHLAGTEIAALRRQLADLETGKTIWFNTANQIARQRDEARAALADAQASHEAQLAQVGEQLADTGEKLSRAITALGEVKLAAEQALTLLPEPYGPAFAAELDGVRSHLRSIAQAAGDAGAGNGLNAALSVAKEERSAWKQRAEQAERDLAAARARAEALADTVREMQADLDRARDAGVTYQCVREALRDMASEEITMGRLIEIMREAVVALAAHPAPGAEPKQEPDGSSPWDYLPEPAPLAAPHESRKEADHAPQPVTPASLPGPSPEGDTASRAPIDPTRAVVDADLLRAMERVVEAAVAWVEVGPNATQSARLIEAVREYRALALDREREGGGR